MNIVLNCHFFKHQILLDVSALKICCFTYELNIYDQVLYIQYNKPHEYPIHVRHCPSPTPHIYPPIGNLINLMKLERGQEKEKDGRPPGLQLPDGVEDVVLVHGTPVLQPFCFISKANLSRSGTN